MKKIFVLLAAALSAAGCRQNKIDDPNVPAGLYFYWGSRESEQKESFDMTFAFMHDTVWHAMTYIDIVAVGELSNQARPIGLQQMLDGKSDAIALPADKDITKTKAYLYYKAAKEGVDLSTPEKVEAATKDGITAHYVAFDHPKLMEWVREYGLYGLYTDKLWEMYEKYNNTSLPAASNRVYYPVMLLKDPSMSTFTSKNALVAPGMPLDIKVKVKPNACFGEGIYDRNIAGRNTDYTIFFTNMMAPPTTWKNYWSRYFKSWGPVKFQYLRDATGFTDWQFDKTKQSDISYDQLSFMTAKTQERIDAYNKLHPDAPLREPTVAGQGYSGQLVSAKAEYPDTPAN